MAIARRLLSNQVRKLGDIGHVFELIDHFDQSLDRLALHGTGRSLAVAPEFLEVRVCAQRLGWIAQDDVEPDRLAGAVMQGDLDLDRRQSVGIARVLHLDDDPVRQCLAPSVAIRLGREILRTLRCP